MKTEVYLVSTYDIGQKIIELSNKNNLKVVTIECAFGNKLLDQNIPGVELSIDHHIGDTIPSISWNIDYSKYKKDIIILSHIDTDTIFGLGWVLEEFPKTEKYKKIGEYISKIDTGGFHSVVFDTPEEMYLVNVIYSEVNKLKKSIRYNKFIKINPRYILNKIKFFMNYPDRVHKKYLKIKDALKDLNYRIIREYSCKNILVVEGRTIDFNINPDLDFIINIDTEKFTSLQIFGRDKETVQKYFGDKGLDYLLSKFFNNAGGQFLAAGTGRGEKVNNQKINWFLQNFRAMVEKGAKYEFKN